MPYLMEFTMENLGEYLKSERERKGVTLEEASKVTKIRKTYLQAIEDGNFEMQSPIFMRGFLKSYAAFLGLDGTDLLERYKQTLPENAVESETETKEPETGKDFSRYTVPITAIFLIIVVIAIAAIIKLREQPYVTSNNSKPPTANTQADKPEVKTAKSTIQPILTTATKGRVFKPLTTSKIRQTAYAAKSHTPAQKNESSEKRQTLLIAARELTWLRIAIDDQNPFEVLLKEGETATWTGSKKFLILSGNAGGIDITFNGKQLESFGPHGKVVTKVLQE